MAYFSIDINKITSQAAVLLEIGKAVEEPLNCIKDIRGILSQISIIGLSGALDELENSLIEIIRSIMSETLSIGEIIKIYRDIDKNLILQFVVDLSLDKYKNGETLNVLDRIILEQYYDELCSNRYGGGGNILSLKDNPAYRDELIMVYESLYPDETKKTDNFLSGMANDTSGKYLEDVANIKYIIYTSDETYRNLFHNYADDFSIAEYDTENQIYSGNTKEIKVKLTGNEKDKYGLYDKQGPYVSFFHEIGHAIDDAIVKDAVDSTLWATEGEKYNELYGIARAEVRRRLLIEVIKADREITDITLDSTERDKIVGRIMNPYINAKDFKEGSNEKAIIDKINQNMKLEISGNSSHSGISYVYHGFTNGKIELGWEPDDTSTSYWNYGDGATNYIQPREMWADYYSRSMLGESEVLDRYHKDYFPESSIWMYHMALKYSKEGA